MSDYAALAQRVAGLSGIRGCLVLSRDGMVLGAYPEREVEAQLKAAWLRFAVLGDPERSEVEFADQTWAYVRRGGYAAFVVADVGVRPGVLLDLLDQVLMAGEIERVHDREAMRLPEAPTAPSGKPRTSLHRPDRVLGPPPQPTAAPVAAKELWVPEEAAAEAAPAQPADVAAEAGPLDEPASTTETERLPIEPDEDAEVDRILLAKEFAGLLQVLKDDDEATR
jgi:predicted regulator of Ras-like GTPase activity (Roadblock/LC7/MglB family)